VNCSNIWNSISDIANGDLAAIVVSAFDYRFSRDLEMPTEEFVKGVRDICDKTGALLILDDVRAGFRISMHGSWHGLYEINVDLLCYSKVL
jgi:glutamate-1-semialdehyde 2,1-aminomutase